MSTWKITQEQILQEILQELKEIRKSVQELKEIRKSVARFDEFVLELSPSEAREEISDLEQ